jgi:hypothetical protein
MILGGASAKLGEYLWNELIAQTKKLSDRIPFETETKKQELKNVPQKEQPGIRRHRSGGYSPPIAHLVGERRTSESNQRGGSKAQNSRV